MNKTLLAFFTVFSVILILVYMTNNLISKELDSKPRASISAPQAVKPSQPVEDKVKVVQPPADVEETASPSTNNASPDNSLTNQQIIYELPLEDKILVQ